VSGFVLPVHCQRINKNGKKRDFLLTVDNKPWFAVEVKSGSLEVPSQMYYFKDKLRIPYNYLISNNCRNEKVVKGIRVMSVDKFLTGLI